MKRSLCLAFSVLMMASFLVLTACGQEEIILHANPQVLTEAGRYPIIQDAYKSEVSIKIMGANNAAINPDWKNNKFFNRMTELTGLRLEFEVYGDDMYAEKKSLYLSTRENMPDVFFKAQFSNYDEATYGGTSLRGLNELIDGYAPHIKKILDDNPVVKKSVTTTNGEIYAIPAVYTNMPMYGDKRIDSIMRSFLWINTEWLAAIGEPAPKTADDLLRVLRLFKAEKCQGKSHAFPLVIAGIDQLLPLFNIFGLDLTQYWVQGKGADAISFGPQTENFKEALKFLRTLVREGLINDNWSTFTPAQMQANGSVSGPDGDIYGAYFSASPQFVSGFNRLEKFATLDPLTSAVNDDAFWGSLHGLQRGCFAITTACKYPEAAIRWLDSLYDLDKPYGLWGIIGGEAEEWEWLDEEKARWKSTVSEADYSKIMATTIIQTGDGMPYAIDESFFSKQQTPTDLYTRPLRDRQMSFGRVSYPQVYFDKSDIKTMADIGTDINSYINRFIASSLSTDGYVDSNFEGFKRFDRLRLDKYLEILKGRYIAFQAAADQS
jgi:putative aldouronate transport system substrate-binding protein